MLAGRSFVAHLVFSVSNAGAAVIIRDDFRAIVTHPAAGTYEITLTDDCAVADAVPMLSSSPNGGATGGGFVGFNWLRLSSSVFRIYTHVGSVQLDAGPPAVFGFAAGGAPVNPATNTIVTFSLDRVDTV